MITTINSLRLENFANIAQTNLDNLAPNVAFVGYNKQGKSSHLLALQFLCMGWCFTASDPPQVKRNGAGAECLIRDSSMQAVISAEIEIDDETGAQTRIWALSCTIKRKGANEWTATNCDTGKVEYTNREDFWRAHGINPAHLIPSLMPDVFITTQSEWATVADVVAPQLDAGAVLAECGDHRQWFQAFAGRTGNPLEIAADFQALGERAYAERTERNAAKKEADTLLLNMPPKPRPVNATGTPIAVTDIDSLRKGVDRQDGIVRALHEELGRAQAAGSVDREALALDAEDAARIETAAQATLQAAERVKATAEEALTQARQREANASHDAKGAHKEADAAEKALKALDSDESCPTCGRKYTDKIRDAVIVPLRDALALAEGKYAGAKAEADAALAALTPARAEAGEATQAHSIAADGARMAAQRAADTRARLEAAPIDARPTADVEADIAAAQEKLERGRALIAQLEIVAEHEELAAHIKAVDAELDHLNWAVKGFKDGDILRPLLRGGLEEFADTCNGELRPYGYSLAVDVQGKKISVQIQEDGKHAHSTGRSSKSERILASAAIALAFGDRGGIVCLDDIDGLDAKWRKQMLSRIKHRAGGSLWVAWACQTSAVAWAEVAAQLAPVTVVNVEAGASAIVGAAEVAG